MAQPPNPNSHGRLTAETAKHLQDLLRGKGYEVLYDHGDASNKNVGAIVSWFDNGKKPERETELSQIDIAITEANSDKTMALIEIEETSDRPKTLLGDIFGTLAGDHINFRDRPLSVGVWTTLIMVSYNKAPNTRRNQYILARVQRVKPALGSKNSSIGKVLIKNFSDEAKLFSLIFYELDKSFKE